MTPSDRFRCELLACDLSHAKCIERQEARFHPTKAPVHYPCGLGKCAQGAKIRAALPDYVPPKFENYRSDRRSQRIARQKWLDDRRVPTFERPPTPPAKEPPLVNLTRPTVVNATGTEHRVLVSPRSLPDAYLLECLDELLRRKVREVVELAVKERRR